MTIRLAAFLVVVGAGVVVYACGDGDQVTEPQDEYTVGPEGGDLTVDGVTLSVPAGALSEEVTFRVEPASVEDLEGQGMTAEQIGYVVPGTVVDLGPDGLSFDAPIDVTLSYDPSDLSDGFAEEQLHMATVSGVWELLSSEVDAGADEVTASVDHFSYFMLTEEALIDAAASAEEVITVADSVSLAYGSVPVQQTEVITVSDSVTLQAVESAGFAWVGAQGSGIVSVIDRSTREVVDQLVAGNAFTLAARPGADEVWVGRGGDQAIDVIDTGTRTVVASISGHFSYDLEFTSDGGTAWLSTGTGSSSLVEIDAATRSVTGIYGGIAAFSRGLALAPDTALAYVVASDTVVVFDLQARAAVDTLTGSFSGVSAAVTPDGTTLVVADDRDGELELFDLTAADPAPVAVPVGAGAVGVAISDDGSAAYTADEGGHTVTPVDLALGEAGAAINVASGPFRIALSENGQTAWVTQRAAETVAVVDLVSGTVLTTVTVGTFPSDVVLVP